MKEDDMWIFTKYGFFSASATKRDNKIMIRTREWAHLRNLQKRFATLCPYVIKESQGTDYQFRLVVPRDLWVEVVAELAREQTWSNFKDEAQKFEKENKQSYAYVDALHDVWMRMRQTVKDLDGYEDLLAKYTKKVAAAAVPPTMPPVVTKGGK
jgi:hypothetical protein